MNISSLRVYYSKEGLTPRFADYSNVYVLPPICAFGIATNILCIIVSAKRDESNAKSLDYILLNSVIDVVFLLIEFFLFIIRCGALCPYGYTYGAKFYEIYIYLFVGYVLITSQVLLSMYIAWDRLKMFSGKLTAKKPKLNLYMVYIIFFIIGAILNTPRFVISKILIPFGIFKSNENSTTYEIMWMRSTKSEYQSPLAQWLLTALAIINYPLLYGLLFLLNIWLCVKFRMYLKSRKHLKYSTSSNLSPYLFLIDLYFISNIVLLLLKLIRLQLVPVQMTIQLHPNVTCQAIEKKEISQF